SLDLFPNSDRHRKMSRSQVMQIHSCTYVEDAFSSLGYQLVCLHPLGSKTRAVLRYQKILTCATLKFQWPKLDGERACQVSMYTIMNCKQGVRRRVCSRD